MPAGHIVKSVAGFICAASTLLVTPPVFGAEPGDPLSDSQPLVLVSKILLGDIPGRLDHMAIDLARRRLYVAERSNDSVAVIDLEKERVLRRLDDLSRPQGLAYEPATDLLTVANGGDGTLKLFQGSALKPAGSIELGKDADNVRIDAASGRIYVGYGEGAIAVIDSASRKKLADIPLKAHPEGFQISPSGGQLFVNVPDAGEITVVDQENDETPVRWPTGRLRANFPMVFDAANAQVVAIFRSPSTLASFSTTDGEPVASIDTCEDADDVFLDSDRQRAYVICGEGVVETFSYAPHRINGMGRIATSPGARTGLFVPQLDRLFVAVRRTATEPAAIWILRPSH